MHRFAPFPIVFTFLEGFVYAAANVIILFYQGFAEKLFSRLQTCNERFEVNPSISHKENVL